MGRNYLADIPGNFFTFKLTHASTASNGASVRTPDCFVAPANLKILSAWRQVQADEATKGTATTSASYRPYYLMNGGTSGTATTSLAGLSQTASQAQYGTRSFTLAGTPTAAAGDIIYFQHGASQGA